jgi:hypothetical protein
LGGDYQIVLTLTEDDIIHLAAEALRDWSLEDFSKKLASASNKLPTKGISDE